MQFKIERRQLRVITLFGRSYSLLPWITFYIGLDEAGLTAGETRVTEFTVRLCYKARAVRVGAFRTRDGARRLLWAVVAGRTDVRVSSLSRRGRLRVLNAEVTCREGETRR